MAGYRHLRTSGVYENTLRERHPRDSLNQLHRQYQGVPGSALNGDSLAQQHPKQPGVPRFDRVGEPIKFKANTTLVLSFFARHGENVEINVPCFLPSRNTKKTE